MGRKRAKRRGAGKGTTRRLMTTDNRKDKDFIHEDLTVEKLKRHKGYYVIERLLAARATFPVDRVQRRECGVFSWLEYCAVCEYAEADGPQYATAGCLMSVETPYWRISQLRSRVKRIKRLSGMSCPGCCVCPPCLERVVAWSEERIAKKQGTTRVTSIQDHDITTTPTSPQSPSPRQVGSGSPATKRQKSATRTSTNLLISVLLLRLPSSRRD